MVACPVPDALLTFPPDSEWRKQIQPAGARRHPGKLHLGFLAWLLDAYVAPGARLLDPLAGSGSLLMATLPPWGCHVTLNELEPQWVGQAAATWTHLQRSLVAPTGPATIRQGDARTLDGPPVNCICTSPPYWDALSWQRHTDTDWERETARGGGGVQSRLQIKQGYGAPTPGRRDPAQIGNLRGARYAAAMAAVYAACVPLLRPGGTMIVVLKNIVRDNREVDLLGQARDQLEALGLRYETTHWRAVRLGPFHAIRRTRNAAALIVDREGALVLRKPEVAR